MMLWFEALNSNKIKSILAYLIAPTFVGVFLFFLLDKRTERDIIYLLILIKYQFILTFQGGKYG